MANVLVLAHADDIDGIGSAAVLRMRYRMSLKNIFFSNYTIKDLESAELRLKRLCGRNTTLFIADLGAGLGSMDVFIRIIRMVKANGGSVVWFDHHFWTKELIKRIASLCDLAVIGGDRWCTTEIAQRYTGINNPFVRKFARLAHQSDFRSYMDAGRMIPRSRNLFRKYAMSIYHSNMSGSYDVRQRRLRHIVNVLCSGRLTDRVISEAASRFEKINRERIKRMLKNLYIISDKIAVGFSKQVESTGACMAVISRARVDVGVVINTFAGKAHIRSIKTDVSGLAGALGGGGHEHAAGFGISMRHDLRKEKYRRLMVKRIQEKARESGIIS